MTLLARVGEQLYWAGRYLERAEGVARLVREHTNLLVDMPTSEPLTWEPLLDMAADRTEFFEHHATADEASIVRFLVGSPDNRSSIAGCVEQARENLRACREVVPTEAWLVANDLHLYMTARRDEGVDRRSRTRIADRVIEDHQRFLGILLGNMSRDDAFTLMRLGRHIERAAITTCVLDVRAARLLEDREAVRYEEVQWIGVLRSLSGLHMYHRTATEPVSAIAAIRFLLLEATFPRSVAYALASVLETSDRLPMPDRVMPACVAAIETLGRVRGQDVTAERLHATAKMLGDSVARIHDRLTESYFPEAVTVS